MDAETRVSTAKNDRSCLYDWDCEQFVQHVVLYFKHDIRAIIPYYDAVERIRQLLSETRAGEYVEDDMAIDGGDAEVVLRGPSADVLYETIFPILKDLSFMRGARVTLVYGSLGSGYPETMFELET
jgi:hypothetical protein